MVRDEAKSIAKQLIDRRVIRIAEARGGLDQRIKYPLQVERRPADDLQGVGGGRLLFQGFCQLTLARLLCLEQSRVLDGYDGLVGKGAQQRDLTRWEAPGLGLSYRDGADRASVLEHRHRREALEVLHPRYVTVLIIGIGIDVGDLGDRTGLDGAGRSTGPAGRQRIGAA